MRYKRAAVAGAALVTGVGGCSAPPAALGTTTAEVSIDGRATNGPYPVRCSQTGSMWIIETPDEANGFMAMLRTMPQMTAGGVQIHDLGSFSGVFWNGIVGTADASIDSGTFTISGEAEGYFSEQPTDRVTTPFEIQAHC
jgi:ipoprotein LpqH